MGLRPSFIDSHLTYTVFGSRQRSRSFITVTKALSKVSAWPAPPPPTGIDNDHIARLASKPLHLLTLADLVRHGRPPLSTDALLASANFTLSLIPSRLAHRINAIRNLPFIVVSNPHINRIYNYYLHSLSTLLPYQEKTITNLQDEIKFTEVMADLVQTHSNTIPILAQGFLECRKYIGGAEVTAFLDEHLRARIGTRLIAEQHIALHLSSQPHQAPGGTQLCHAVSSSHVGVIDTALRPVEIIRRCESTVGEICELRYGVRPSIMIESQSDTELAHVPTHIEYILTELLKNAFRATIESGKEREPIMITVASSADSSPGDLDHTERDPSSSSILSGVEASNPVVTIRLRDRGGGIPANILPHIWGYSFTTFSDEDVPVNDDRVNLLHTISHIPGGGGSLAGLGYGLPLGRAYAEYFGGELSIQSLWGWGTDAYLRLQGLRAM